MKTKSKPSAYFDVPAMNQQAIASQFKQFRTEVADAIREKKGTTDPIDPKDFGEEIKNLSGGGSSSEIPEVMGLMVEELAFGDSSYYSVCFDNQNQIIDPTFEDLVEQFWILNNYTHITIVNGRVFYNNKPLYHDCDGSGWGSTLSNPVLSSDKIEPRIYYITNMGGE